jgi:hypothetical protein
MSGPARAGCEMVQVACDGATIAGAVWDVQGGLPHARLLLDTAAMFDPAAFVMRKRYMKVPLTQAGEGEAPWRSLGLTGLEQRAVSIRMDFANFADDREPFRRGQGTMGEYVAALDNGAFERLSAPVRAAHAGRAPAGPRSFLASAWFGRGMVSKMPHAITGGR